MYKDAPASETDWEEGSAGRAGGSSGLRRDIITLRSAPREAPPAAERPQTEPLTEPPQTEPGQKEGKPSGQGEKPAKGKRKGWLRRHPILAPVGLAALLLAAVAGWIYWDHISHFESTDDAFIAARQFAIAPQVAGYVTAVPVTDNQHVAKGAGDREDRPRATTSRRSRRPALRLRGAQAGIHNIDAQIATQQAQIAASQAQVAQAQANLEFAETPGSATSRSSNRAGRRRSRERSTSRASRPSRPRSTARKPR